MTGPFRTFFLPDVRLRQIKIAGFKSFADLTVIDIDVPLTAIVGPNGCGKSNIIDAVRWVLGEGRASELRGEARMTELIFAGSTARAELGRASVELILETDGTLEGPWGAYAELSVKRVITRDGDSTYSINRQTVRRRDVQELFAGTGLGTKSYAIISQGTVSQFIRARPEELRNYFEEAAGVGLYRERRRETETLLRQTRENLERAADLQTVKKETMERLRAEAETAARWEKLDEERRSAEARLFWGQREEARASVREMDVVIGNLSRAVDETKDRLRSLEDAGPEAERRFETARSEALATGERVREAEREIAALEARLAEDRRRRAEAADTLRAAEDAVREKEAERAELEAQTQQDRERLAQLEVEGKALEESVARAADLTISAEKALAEERRSTEVVETECRRWESALESARAQKRSLEDRLQSLSRHRMLQRDAERPVVPDAAEEEKLRDRKTLAQKDLEEAREARERLGRRMADAERSVREKAREYERALAEERTAAAKWEAAREALGRAEKAGDLDRWLERRGLSAKPRLSSLVTVDPAWITAADAVLAEETGARWLDKDGDAARLTGERAPAKTSFWGPGAPESPEGKAALSAGGVTLPAFLSVFSVPDPTVKDVFAERLAGHYAVESLEKALSLREKLPAGATLVTPEGDRVTRGRVRLWARTTEGVLTLSEAVRKTAARHAEAKASFERIRAEQDEAQKNERALRDAQRDLQRQLRETEEALKKGEWAIERFLERKREAIKRLEELERREKLWAEEEAALRKNREENDAKLRELEALAPERAKRRDEARAQTERARSALEHARSEQKALDYRAKLMALEAGECRKALSAARVRFERVETDVKRERDRAEKARALLEDKGEGLAEALEIRRAALGEVRRLADEARGREEAALRELTGLREEERRLRGELLPLTETIGRRQTDRQAKFVLYEQFAERFRETGFDEGVVAGLAERDPARVPALKVRLQKLAGEQQRLGEVNHAALAGLRKAEEEYETARRTMEDLEEAAKTLETAIRKIDAETRVRIRTTFEAVARAFEETFTELFGGGEAKLVLRGDDVLEAGVEVTARPPGKKNASLTQLSGGEQSLAATALVFAFFRLNPAPFCLLDEVDAALDEANQGRLASLCRRLSEKTQFLLITHNRVTMEYADVLIGVTMKEPGVSRVVSVDIEEASGWARTA